MAELTTEEQDYVLAVRDWVKREVLPVVRELEHANTYPERLIEQMKRLGIFGLAIPEQYGGAPVSMPCYAHVTEELARGLDEPGRRDGRAHRRRQAAARVRHRRAEADRYLPRMATGEVPGDDGAHRARRRLRPAGDHDHGARRDGDDYVVNGTKTWITNARRSSADRAAVQDRSRRPTPRHKGISILLVEQGARVSPSRGTCPSSATRASRAASWPSTTSGSRPTRCSADVEGKGFAQMMQGLEIGRIQVAVRALGVGRAALEDAMRYAQERETLRQADLAAPVDRQLPRRHGHQAARPPASSSLLRRRALRPGERCDMEAGMAKLFASEAAMQIALNAVRIHGGYGYSTEFDVERYFRDAPLMIVGEGTNEIQRNVIVCQLMSRGLGPINRP